VRYLRDEAVCEHLPEAQGDSSTMALTRAQGVEDSNGPMVVYNL
jgi:hypothetical protein